MIYVKIYATNMNNDEIILFESEVIDKYNYKVLTDLGAIYENDFALALKGEFTVEVYNNYTKESETIVINSEDYVKNIELFCNYLSDCTGVRFIIDKVDEID